MRILLIKIWSVDMAKTKRRFGDRKDGRKIRSLAPYNTFSSYIMVSRNDAQNYLADKFETAEVDRYVQQKRSSGLDGFGILHVILAAYVRMISQRPGINCFISGQKFMPDRKLSSIWSSKKTPRGWNRYCNQNNLWSVRHRRRSLSALPRYPDKGLRKKKKTTLTQRPEYWMISLA